MTLKTAELNRLRWRCRRGLLELDIVLVRFIDQHFGQLTVAEKSEFNALLALPDNDLWDIISGDHPDQLDQERRLLSLLRQC